MNNSYDPIEQLTYWILRMETYDESSLNLGLEFERELRKLADEIRTNLVEDPTAASSKVSNAACKLEMLWHTRDLKNRDMLFLKELAHALNRWQQRHERFARDLTPRDIVARLKKL